MTKLYSQSAEQSVLGSVLLNSSILDELLFLEPKHFHGQHEAMIFGGMLQLYFENEPIHEVTIFNKLDQPDWGLKALDALSRHGGTGKRAEYCAKQVVEMATRRAMIAGCNQIAQLAASDTPSDTFMSEAQEIFSNSIQGINVDEPDSLGHVLTKVLEEVQKGKEQTQLLQTGIQSIDDLTGGLAKGLVTIVAARPAMGKSCMAVNMIANMGRAGKNVLFTSLEDTSHFIGVRMLSRFADINASSLAHCNVAKEDYKAILDAMNDLPREKVWIDDKPGRTVHNIRYMATMLKKRHGLDVLFLDHLGELTNDADSYASTSANIRAMRDIAKDLDIPVVVMAQLNRAQQGQANPRPQISNLRDSGRIEEVARNIWFLHREAYYDPEASERDLELIVAKATHGRTGKIMLDIDLNHMRIKSIGDY